MPFLLNQTALCTLLVFGCAATAGADELVRRLSPAEARNMAVAKPQPTYPPMAKQLRLEGKVDVEASIAEDGSVDNVKILSGNAVLTVAAAEATKHWKFQPVTADGKPVRAVATLSFQFKM